MISRELPAHEGHPAFSPREGSALCTLTKLVTLRPSKSVTAVSVTIELPQAPKAGRYCQTSHETVEAILVPSGDTSTCCKPRGYQSTAFGLELLQNWDWESCGCSNFVRTRPRRSMTQTQPLVPSFLAATTTSPASEREG